MPKGHKLNTFWMCTDGFQSFCYLLLDVSRSLFSFYFYMDSDPAVKWTKVLSNLICTFWMCIDGFQNFQCLHSYVISTCKLCNCFSEITIPTYRNDSENVSWNTEQNLTKCTCHIHTVHRGRIATLLTVKRFSKSLSKPVLRTRIRRINMFFGPPGSGSGSLPKCHGSATLFKSNTGYKLFFNLYFCSCDPLVHGGDGATDVRGREARHPPADWRRVREIRGTGPTHSRQGGQGQVTYFSLV